MKAMLGVVLAAGLLAAARGAAVPFGTADAVGDAIPSLPGYKGNTSMFGGYVTVDTESNRRLYYFLTEATEAAGPDAPLALWLNGGPGCSSVGGGLMSENGPWFPVKNAAGDIELQDNPWAWNGVANMVYLESPAGVGFSFSDNPADYTVGDNRTAEDTWRFLQGFLSTFEKFQGSEFWISGESYGGHYVPGAALAIVQHNAAHDAVFHEVLAQTGDAAHAKRVATEKEGIRINLKGIQVGNAWTDAPLDNEGTAFWWWSHSFISTDTYNGMLDNCNFSNVGPLEANGETAVRDGWSALAGWESKEGVDPAACNNAVNDAFTEQGDAFNIYNFNALVCLDSDGNLRLPRAVETITRALGRSPPGLPSRRALGADDDFGGSNVPSGAAAFYEPCIDDLTTSYLNTPDVQAAIHANTSLGYPWAECSNIIDYSRADLLSSMLPVYQQLFDADIRINVFSGMADAIVPTSGTRKWMAALNMTITDSWRPWYTSNKQLGGWTQGYEHLNFTTVRNAGHMVPQVQPSRALHMFRSYLRGEKL